MIISGVGWIFVSLLKETYSPALLRKKAQLRRKETGDERYWSRYDDQKGSFFDLLKVNLSRPFVMIFTEPIWYVVKRKSRLCLMPLLLTRRSS